MARFSKAALLKWLHEQKNGAEAVAFQYYGKGSKKADFWDGKMVAFREVINAIERGEIGEGE